VREDDVLVGFRLRLFTLADELGNVSAACRAMGVDRSTYYRSTGSEPGARIVCLSGSDGVPLGDPLTTRPRERRLDIRGFVIASVTAEARGALDRTQEVGVRVPLAPRFLLLAGHLSLTCGLRPYRQCVHPPVPKIFDLQGFCRWSDRFVGFQAVIWCRRA
jgi:hypothetical protein